MTPDTWCDREMWAQFRGTMTPEEAMKLAAIRRNAYSSKVQNGADKKQRREARAYERAVLADRENRLRQRTVE
jgi:hypothetical protein